MKKILLTAFISISATALFAQDCSNLFFSEYVEGSANNKTLEIYNPTDNPVDLSSYLIKRYSNGSPVPTEQLALSGMLQPKDVVVVTNGQTDSVWVQNGGYWSLPISEELFNMGDLHCSGIYPTPMYFNGDDAMTLETVTGGVIDIFGKIGEQPENGWNDIPPSYTAGSQFWTSWTEDQTLIRKYSVKQGVTTNPALFMVHVEWDSIPKDTFDSLGFHRCDCGSTGIIDTYEPKHSLVVYPNPAAGDYVQFNTTGKVGKIELINITGRKMDEFIMDNTGNTGRIYTGDLPEGMYILKFNYTDDTFAFTKFLKR